MAEISAKDVKALRDATGAGRGRANVAWQPTIRVLRRQLAPQRAAAAG